MQTNYVAKKMWSACGFLVVLAAVAALVKTHSGVLQGFDHAIQSIFTPITNSHTTSLVETFTKFGSPAVSLGLSVLVIIFVYVMFSHRDAIWGFSLIIVGNGGAYVIKHLVARARPTDKLMPETGYSFPSGHTFATALLVLLLLRLVIARLRSDTLKMWLNVLLPLWVLFIMITRIYLHVHYPSDTIASLLWCGALWQAGLGLYYWRYHHELGAL